MVSPEHHQLLVQLAEAQDTTISGVLADIIVRSQQPSLFAGIPDDPAIVSAIGDLVRTITTSVERTAIEKVVNSLRGQRD